MVGNLKLEDIWESVNDISLFFFEGVYKGFYIESLLKLINFEIYPFTRTKVYFLKQQERLSPERIF